MPYPMKHLLLPLHILLLLCPPLAAHGTRQPAYPPPKQPAARQLKHYDTAPRDYISYLAASSANPFELETDGHPIDSATLPWNETFRLAPGDSLRIRRMIDSLYIAEPGPGDDSGCFRLYSRYPYIPAEPQDDGTQTNGYTGLFPFRPGNEKLNGLHTSSLPVLGNATMRIVYTFRDDEGEPILLTDDYENAWFRSAVGDGWGENSFHFRFRDSSRTFQDIRNGYIEIEITTPARYDHVTLSAAEVGQTFFPGGQPVRLLAFGPGYFHLSYPNLSLRTLQQIHLAFFRAGKELPQRLLAGGVIGRDFYDFSRAHPGLTPRKFTARRKNMEHRPAGEFAEVFWTGVDADRIVLYCPRTDAVVASRIIVFSRDETGAYGFSLLRKGNDGVLRPLAGDPEGMTPPEYREGREAMFRKIAASIVYPPAAAANGIEGTVYVSATIGRDGRMVSTRVQQGVDPQLDAEALRVVALLKTWKPATKQGRTTEMNVLLPIVFRIR